jgi:hypothetical protein
MMQQRPSSKQENASELPYALKVFLLLSIGLTLLSFIYTIVCRYLNLGLPYSFPYYYPVGDMFSDLVGFRNKFHQWGTPAFFDPKQTGYFLYPAPLVHVFHVLLNLPHTQTCFMSLLFAASIFLAAMFVRVLRRQGLATGQSILFVSATALLSYPFVFLIQRGNIEFLVWFIGSLGVWLFFAGRTNASAVLIGVAASLKLYPFIFLGLFLPRRKYGGFFLGIASFAIVTVASMYAIGPTIAAAAHWNGEQMAVFSKYFVGGLLNIGYDHSFFALLKVATLHWFPDSFAWARPYTITVAIISVTLYFLRMWRLPLPNQILALSVLSVTLAPVSYDYTLLNLYPAFAMLAVLALQARRHGTSIPHLTIHMVLFAMIFTPQSYVIFHGVRYGAQVRTICLIIMLVLGLITPIPEPESSNARPLLDA